MVQQLSGISVTSLQLGLAEAERLHNLCAALSNTHRAKLACLANRYPGLSYSELSALIEVPLALLSYHAGRLISAGLLQVERDGRKHRVYLHTRVRPFIVGFLERSCSNSELE